MMREYTAANKQPTGGFHYKPASDKLVPSLLRKAVERTIRLAAIVAEQPQPTVIFVQECKADESTLRFHTALVTQSKRYRHGGASKDLKHEIYVNIEAEPGKAVKAIGNYLEGAMQEARQSGDRIVHSTTYDR